MKRHGPASYEINTLAEYLKYYRPPEGMAVRLFAGDETSYPPSGSPALPMFPSCIPPEVPPGRYWLQYYDRQGNAIEQPESERKSIEVDERMSTVRSPAQISAAEDRLNQRLERREMRNRREAAVTQTVEDSQAIVQRLSSTIAENNERHSRTLAEFHEKLLAQTAEREASILVVVKDVMGVVQEHTRSAGQSHEQQVRMIEHLVTKARESTDWAGVAKEVISQLGGLAQSLVSAPREGDLRDGQARLPAKGGAGRESSSGPPALPAAGGGSAGKKDSAPAKAESASRTASSTSAEPRETKTESAPVAPSAASEGPRPSADAEAEVAWFEQFFGLSDPRPPDSSAHREVEVLPPPTLAEAVQPRAVTCVAAAESEPPGEVLGAVSGTASIEASGAGAEPAAPFDLADLLAKLMPTAGAPAAVPRPQEWSRAWALREIKRRVFSLGELGFVITVTQPRRLLRFLRDLIAAVKPPPPLRLLPAGGTP